MGTHRVCYAFRFTGNVSLNPSCALANSCLQVLISHRITNETERPELPALSAETSSSSSAVTDEQPSYQMTSPYNPDVYKCTGYRGEPYEYFDGTPGEGKDQRFTIDIEHGTMDR